MDCSWMKANRVSMEYNKGVVEYLELEGKNS